MIVGRAFETTVEDRNATNIASNIPESASRISRWRHLPLLLGRGGLPRRGVGSAADSTGCCSLFS